MELNTEHTTQVKIQITQIKCIDDMDNIIILDAYGKLNQTQSKKIAKENNLLFISKEVVTNDHDVKTSDLIQLINQ